MYILSSCLLATSANVTSQRIAGAKKLNQHSVFAYGLFGILFGGTVPHYFYQTVERLFSDLRFKKFFLFLSERLAFAPFYQLLSLYFLSIFEVSWGRDNFRRYIWYVSYLSAGQVACHGLKELGDSLLARAAYQLAVSLSVGLSEYSLRSAHATFHFVQHHIIHLGRLPGTETSSSAGEAGCWAILLSTFHRGTLSLSNSIFSKLTSKRISDIEGQLYCIYKNIYILRIALVKTSNCSVYIYTYRCLYTPHIALGALSFQRFRPSQIPFGWTLYLLLDCCLWVCVCVKIIYSLKIINN